MADAPTVKPWSIDDKKKLQQLIDSGKVDISRTEDIGYIDSVRFKYYRERDNVNFRRNFRNYARSVTSRSTTEGTALVLQQEEVYCILSCAFIIILSI